MKSRAPLPWSRLDNAAKLFASVSDKSDPKVFRFSCELNAPVSPEDLQTALERTLEYFPTFRTVLRRGLFWYYLEGSHREALVKIEDKQPCSPLYDRIQKSLLFSVTYFRRRINFEVYHAVTDGTGALHFMRMLVHQYMLTNHADIFAEAPPILDYDASQAQKSDDSFRKYYVGSKNPNRVKVPSACHIKGAVLSDYRMRVISGVLSVSQVLAQVRSMGTTLTAFLTSTLLSAINHELPARDAGKPVVCTVPVNLRNYFESASARNFFGIFNVGYTFEDENESLENIITSVTNQFKSELEPEKLAIRMNNLSAMEHNPFARIIPLPLKDFIMMIANKISQSGVTAVLSNVGKIDMPPEYAPYINMFDVFISTRRLQMCMCSYGDKLVLSFTAPFVATDIQKRFFRSLTAIGIDVTINSNLIDEEDSPDEELLISLNTKRQKKKRGAKNADMRKV